MKNKENVHKRDMIYNEKGLTRMSPESQKGNGRSNISRGTNREFTKTNEMYQNTD